MSLSKKHFNNIAKILNDNRNIEEDNFNTNIVLELGIYFKSINKNFDSNKWVDACYKKNESEGK
jgi:hypothetical protein